MAAVGPIWRSSRRHRAFALLILEVSVGFFIVANLVMTMRWYASLGLPPSGHREDDVVEVVVQRPAVPGGVTAASWSVDAARALAALPGVSRVAAVSASQNDDRWAMPVVFWSDDARAAPAGACPHVGRSEDGVVVGWSVEADPALAETIDLRFIEGGSPASPIAFGTSETVIITRCLRDAIFGGASALGKVLRSTRHPPARITGVVEDVRMRVPFLYQTQVTAIFPLPAADERVARFFVRAQPGQAGAVRAAAGAALGGGDPDRIVSARLFSLVGTMCALTASGTVRLLGMVGGLLGVVAILGNLAVAAFFVSDRRRVIGLRRALGATKSDILGYLLVENLLVTQIGNALGLAFTLLFLPGAQRRFAGLHLGPLDVVAATLLLTLGGILATLVPAWRATRIPPSEVSRAL